MSEARQTVFPQISKRTSNLLRQTCQMQGCTPGDVVEAALQAFLSPTEPSERDTLVFQALQRLSQSQATVVAVLDKILAHLEAQAKPVVPVASYGQMYEEKEEVEVSAVNVPEASEETEIPLSPAEQGRQPGWWGRVMPKRRKG